MKGNKRDLRGIICKLEFRGRPKRTNGEAACIQRVASPRMGVTSSLFLPQPVNAGRQPITRRQQHHVPREQNFKEWAQDALMPTQIIERGRCTTQRPLLRQLHGAARPYFFFWCKRRALLAWPEGDTHALFLVPVTGRRFRRQRRRWLLTPALPCWAAWMTWLHHARVPTAPHGPLDL